MAAPVVATRGDMYLAGSLFDVFRLQRIELDEVKGCLELATYFKNALIKHEILV
jgi:hypothetical protein